MNRHRTTVLSATALSIAVWAYACGDGAVEPTEPPPSAATPTTVTVTPETVALSALEDTAQLAAVVRDQNGQVMAGATVQWSSSDILVAVVNAGVVKSGCQRDGNGHRNGGLRLRNGGGDGGPGGGDGHHVAGGGYAACG